MKKNKFSDILPHFVAVIVFLLVTVFFFNPIFFDNKAIEQGDIQQWSGSSKELRDYREQTGEEGLWASAMFSGMPAYLVNLSWDDGVVIGMKKVLSVFLPHPVSNIFIAFICYYILLLSFKIRPWFAIAGALAFGLSSYMIIGLSAGHNARIGAIAFMPLVVAGIHLAFSGKRILGFASTAVGLALHLRENHLQITYYLVLIVIAYGLVQLILAIRTKQLQDFFKTILMLIPAVLIAVGTFFGQFWAITEYTTYSIRGASEIAVKKTGEDVSGLSKSYAFQYKYGVWEAMTLFIPNFYGGSSMDLLAADQSSNTYKSLSQAGNNETANQLANYARAYWGPQDFTAGPYYAGTLVVFLFIIGIVFAEKKYVWWLVPLSALSLMLSMGDSFSSFNYFMFDYFPGYNKFRSVNFALVIILFSMPLLGVVGLEKLVGLGWTKETQRKLMWPFFITVGVCLFFLAVGGFGSFLKSEEVQLPVWLRQAMQKDRVALLRSDAWRALWLILIFSAAIFALLKNYLKPAIIYAVLIVLMWADLAWVDSRYFSKENYKRKRDNAFAVPTGADEVILKDKGYYRVYNLQSPLTEARTSYFHNSLGGYHGAKLRRYQDLYDSILSKETTQIFKDAQQGEIQFDRYQALNMLNAKYLVYGPDKNNVIVNPKANGAAWFVKEVVNVNSPAEELAKTGEVNTREVAVVGRQSTVDSRPLTDSTATVTLIEHTPPYLKYESESTSNGVVVFSEIYYPKGWHAFIDGKEVPILRANYVLRALEVPAGKHTIEFKFEPKPYTVGNKVTMASGWVLLLVALGCFGWSLKEE
ncbi:MAG: YfhO family protein [Cyclobacteriaceae bacterium]|nr:YfhO family protein [Cyclobacteriaceae bacterium]